MSQYPESLPYSATDAAPPSYCEATSASQSSSTTSQLPPPPAPFSTQTQVSSFLRAAHTAHACHLAAHESSLLALLTQSLDAHLSHLLASLSPPPAQLDLTLVPYAAVGPSWTLVNDDDAGNDRRRASYSRVVRIQKEKGKDTLQDDDKKKKSSSGSGGSWEDDDGYKEKGFDDWGRWDDGNDGGDAAAHKEDCWWFYDEDLAVRLARYLMPPPYQPASGGGARHVSSRGARAHDDHVRVTAKADEVTFRRENEMGIWESLRGWGIVVRIKMQRV